MTEKQLINEINQTITRFNAGRPQGFVLLLIGETASDDHLGSNLSAPDVVGALELNLARMRERLAQSKPVAH